MNADLKIETIGIVLKDAKLQNKKVGLVGNKSDKVQMLIDGLQKKFYKVEEAERLLQNTKAFLEAAIDKPHKKMRRMSRKQSDESGDGIIAGARVHDCEEHEASYGYKRHV
jgi:hypothetical protein